jgi:hypothetical protein
MTYVFPGQPAFPQVDSLEPRFRWEPLSNAVVQESLHDRVLSDAGEITYDLKIFRVEERQVPWYDQDYSWFQGLEHGDPGQLYYTREKLREPFHKVDRPLDPATKYYWTVRAAFVVDGHPRVSGWAEQVVRILWPPGQKQVTYFGFETPTK